MPDIRTFLRQAVMGRLGRTTFGGKRDMYSVLGYPEFISFDDYMTKYTRQDIAGTIVDLPATATWRKPPQIHELNADGVMPIPSERGNLTEFEKRWKELERKMKVFATLERLDKTAGIGRWAVLLMGLKGASYSNPIGDGRKFELDDLLYLSVYNEKTSKIEKFVKSTKDPRFGQPDVYHINFSREDRERDIGVIGEIPVHSDHILHVAPDTHEDDVYGRPRLQTVWNRLEDLEKVVGGSSEMFWRAAYGGLHAKVQDNFDLSTEDAEKLSKEIQSFVHGLQRFVRTEGVDLENLNQSITSPESNFNAILDLISGSTRIPKSKLLGVRTGDVAGTEDSEDWDAYVTERQRTFGETCILRPFIDRMVKWGILPEPEHGYEVVWPDIFAMNPVKQSEVARNWGQTIRSLAPPGFAHKLLTRKEMRTRLLNLPEEPEGGYEDEDIFGGAASMEAASRQLNDDPDGEDGDENDVNKRNFGGGRTPARK